MRLLYFGSLVDRLGCAGEEIALPADVIDVRGLVDYLKQRGDAWELVFGRGSVRITVNKQFADLASPVTNSDEVAFISAG